MDLRSQLDGIVQTIQITVESMILSIDETVDRMVIKSAKAEIARSIWQEFDKWLTSGEDGHARLNFNFPELNGQYNFSVQLRITDAYYLGIYVVEDNQPLEDLAMAFLESLQKGEMPDENVSADDYDLKKIKFVLDHHRPFPKIEGYVARTKVFLTFPFNKN